MDKSLHVFVCSTYRDLVSERNAVLDGLDGLCDQFSSLSYHCPRSIQPLDTAKEELRRSDVMVMIVGHLQGVIAPGMDIAHGEAEYLEGASLKKNVLVYLRDLESGLYPAHFERDPQRAVQLKAFRDKLEREHGAKVFDDIYSLVSLVTQDLFRLAQESGLKPKSGPKTVKFRARAWETRKLPVGGIPQLQPQPAQANDSQTRTIPILQKALATPFRRRRAGGGHLARGLALGAAVLALLGLAAAKLKGTPGVKTGPVASATQSPSAAVPAPADGFGNAGPAASVAEIPAPVPVAPLPPKPSGVVKVTDDDDPTKAFLRKATEGSAEDQFQAGQMYETGKDVPRDDSSAFRWYKKAAEQGMAEAQYKVALMYRYGKGTTKSSYAAARWFQTAAEQGHPRAQVKLGQMYKSGKGVPKDETSAFKWFLKAADQKDPEAEKILAELKEN